MTEPQPAAWWSRCDVDHCDAAPATVDLYAGKRCTAHPPQFDPEVAALIAVNFPGTALAYARGFGDEEAAA